MRNLFRPIFITLAFFALLGIAVPQVPAFRTVLGPVIGIEQAEAQTTKKKKKRRSLFDVLFKKRKKKFKRPSVSLRNLRKQRRLARQQRENEKANKLARRSTQKSKKRKSKVAKPVVVVTKSENASKILVVGDFMANGVAKGLTKIYASNPDIQIINKARSGSGLVRNDVVNWVEKIPELNEEFKPVAIVLLAGMNDRQKIRLETKRVEKFSEEWLAEYNSRVEKLANITTGTTTPLVWMGLPPVRFSNMNTDYLAFNEIYRSKVETAGMTYVDVWDGFTNAEGKYVTAGPDINGQIVRLRGKKGISMIRAGNTKLGFFADKALRKLGVIRNAEGLVYASLGTVNTGLAQPLVPQYDPIGTGETVIVALGSPSSDGAIELEGSKGFLASDENKKSVSFSLVENGQVYEPQIGRIDAAWGKTSGRGLSEGEQIDLKAARKFVKAPPSKQAKAPEVTTQN